MIPGSKAPKAFRACTKGFELGYQLGTVMILLFMAVRFCFNTYFWYLLSHFFSAILFIL